MNEENTYMSDDQLVSKYLDVVHEYVMLPHGVDWTLEIGKRQQVLKEQIDEMQPLIEELHLKYKK